MSKDPLDLPVRRPSGTVTQREHMPPAGRPRLTEKQMDAVVQSGAKVMEGVASIASGLVEIAQIRARSGAEVAGIEARSDAMAKVMRAEVERLMAERKGVRTRGEAAARVIEQVMKGIPEADAEARRQALSILPQLVRDVVSPNEGPAGSQS